MLVLARGDHALESASWVQRCIMAAGQAKTQNFSRLQSPNYAVYSSPAVAPAQQFVRKHAVVASWLPGLNRFTVKSSQV
jgi:hypothetical protein